MKTQNKSLDLAHSPNTWTAARTITYLLKCVNKMIPI